MIFHTRNGRLTTSIVGGFLTAGLAGAASAQAPIGPGAYTQQASVDTNFYSGIGGVVEPGPIGGSYGTAPNAINDESFITFLLPKLAAGTQFSKADVSIYLGSGGSLFGTPNFNGDLYAGYGAFVSAADPTYSVNSDSSGNTYLTTAGTTNDTAQTSYPIGLPQETSSYVTSVTPLPNTAAAPDLTKPDPNGTVRLQTGGTSSNPTFTNYDPLPETVNYSLVEAGFLQPTGNGSNNAAAANANKYISISTSNPAAVAAAQATLTQILNLAERGYTSNPNSPVYVTLTTQPNTPTDTANPNGKLSAYPLFGLSQDANGNTHPENLTFSVTAAPEPSPLSAVFIGITAVGGLIMARRRTSKQS